MGYLGKKLTRTKRKALCSWNVSHDAVPKLGQTCPEHTTVILKYHLQNNALHKSDRCSLNAALNGLTEGSQLRWRGS